MESKKIEKLKQMLENERAKVRGYEEVAQVHCAYISILLNKLGATKDNMISITPAEVKEALTNYEARAVLKDGVYSLYCEAADE